MTRLDDPELVAAEYASDARLRRRTSVYTGAIAGVDVRDVVTAAALAARPSAILEVGCGWGELAARLARETGARVVAIDLSPHMVELAQEAGIDARVGDVQQLPFPDEAFDLAVAAWMLYHVPDRMRAIAELARVLRPGGVLIAVTNSMLHLQELRALVASGPSPLAFSREDGRSQLEPFFGSVEQHDVDGVVEFRNRAAVEDYVRSSIVMSPYVENLPLAVEEPIVATRASTVFVATK